MNEYKTLDLALDYLNNGIINESILMNEKDILYNKEAFDNGDINLCFIIGLRGSGKSSMARSESKNNDIEYYELDDVVLNKMNFTMNNLKEYGDLIYSFFKGPGKKYYYTTDDAKNGLIKPVGDNYEELLIRDFIKYCKSYANSHKNKKYIIEGIWLIDFCKPEEFKDYALYIKGTSLIISRWRAAKRDSSDGKNTAEKVLSRAKNFFNYSYMKNEYSLEKDLNKWRNYFKNI